MADAAILLSDGDIAASNVRPAFEASLATGVTEAELERELGWTRAGLSEPDAVVSGASTYRHMEWMQARPAYGAFVVAAACSHTLSSLGVVGLACKTRSTVGEAMACHQRYQHLTNRTARYHLDLEGDRVTFREERPDPSHGSQLISDYTMLVALQLLRDGVAETIAPRVWRSRRASLPDDERAVLEEAAGVALELGADQASLTLDAAVLALPIPSADVELAAYFRGVLERAAPAPSGSPVIDEVQEALRAALADGTPTLAAIARKLGLGQRTLQRRLADEGRTFGEVLEGTRKAMVRGYLDDATLSLAEIAYLLGYSEQASFFRAFRRWYGMTPSAFRKR